MAKNMNQVQEITEMTQEEILQNESSLLEGLLKAADYKEETKKIQIKRNGNLLFEFKIRPLGEDEIQDCRKRATKMIPNPNGRHFGKVEGELDIVALRGYKILTATVDEDREKIWNNSVLKQKLNCLSALDVIDSVLMAGEKDWICDVIDDFSGYGTSQVSAEEYAKN